MGTNWYMRVKNPPRERFMLEDVLIDGYLPAEAGVEVELVRDDKLHLAKTSWGWKPNFQMTPCTLPFGEQVRANEVYNVKCLKDIKALYDTGLYVIENEYGDEVSWAEFDDRVVHWADRQRELCMANGDEPFEPQSHIDDGLGTYLDPDGHEFSPVCFH